MNKESLHYFIHSSEAINLERTLKSLPSKKGRGVPNRRQGEYKKHKKEMQKFNTITIVPSFGARVRYIHRTAGFLINVRIGHNVGSP
jgi:hypothetical protein